MKTQVLQKFEEKKHSVRYNSLINTPMEVIVSSIYVMKDSLPKPFPNKIKLSLEVVED